MTCQFKVLPLDMAIFVMARGSSLWVSSPEFGCHCYHGAIFVACGEKEKRRVMVDCGEVAEFYRFTRFFTRMCCRPFERLISWQQILKATFDALKSTYRQFDGGEKNIWKNMSRWHSSLGGFLHFTSAHDQVVCFLFSKINTISDFQLQQFPCFLNKSVMFISCTVISMFWLLDYRKK